MEGLAYGNRLTRFARRVSLSLARQIAVFCCDQGYNKKKQLTPNVGRQAWASGSVIRASTRPFERSSAATGAELEQNHGDENEWEETHNE